MDSARHSHRSRLQVGDIYKATVSRIESFGAFVDIQLESGNERGSNNITSRISHLDTSQYIITGLVHISQLAKDRVENTSDVVEVHESVFVKVLSIELDKEGKEKVSLSMKYCSQVYIYIYIYMI
jgi:predicted RNA-binding protein with RPS1 domain